VTFIQKTRGSTYIMVVDVSVRLTESKTGKILFQNDHWTFRDVFELGQNSAEFVSEDPAALERLASRFASSFVASVMHAK
jgi:hypothetical protein